MPEEDGYALIAKLRALPPELGGTVPALALTGFAGEGDEARVLECGFQAFLAKPVESAALLAMAERLLG
jgi:CheY-like chemotaxis protein